MVAFPGTQACRAGAKMVGMILWPKSKRSVAPAAAAAIAAAAREGGAEPVGVFVDEDAAQIVAACQAAGVQIAQLHGDGARAALPALPSSLRVIWVVAADADGKLSTPLPGDQHPPTSPDVSGEKGWRKAVDWVSRGRRSVDWLLIDGIHSGRHAGPPALLSPTLAAPLTSNRVQHTGRPPSLRFLSAAPLRRASRGGDALR